MKKKVLHMDGTQIIDYIRKIGAKKNYYLPS